MVELRLAGVIKESIVDGPGIRFVVFSQGCRHNCPECHNPATHAMDGGYMTNSDNIIAEIKKNPMLRGVTLSGGDPFEQAAPMAQLAKEVHALGLNIVTYTGYTFEQLLEGISRRPGWKELLQETDILVDGPFIRAQRDLLLHFRGSKNQRIIDVKTSLEKGEAVVLDL